MTGKTLNTILEYVVILIAIACVSWAAISIYKHFHPAPPVFYPTVLQDSVTQREKKMGRVIDSLISRNNYIVASADSLKLVAIQQQLQLDERKKLTETLSDQYRAYRIKYDTVNALHKCDTLAEEVNQLNIVITKYEGINHRLYDSLQSVTGNNSLIFAKKDYLYSVLRNSFDSLSNEYQLQTSRTKEIKSKRWSIGPQFGITYFDKMRLSGGIGISYSIIKF